jgi:hypothetical protein
MLSYVNWDRRKLSKDRSVGIMIHYIRYQEKLLHIRGVRRILRNDRGVRRMEVSGMLS